MAGTIIDMSKIKQLLQLKRAGITNRQIAKDLKMSRDKANKCGISMLSYCKHEEIRLAPLQGGLQIIGYAHSRNTLFLSEISGCI